MAWRAGRGDHGWENLGVTTPSGDVDGRVNVKILDIFCESPICCAAISDIPIAFSEATIQTFTTDTHGIAAVFLRHGLLPCSPERPRLAITIRTMEIFRVLHLRSPHLSIQAFAKGLLDLHFVPPASYLNDQFSVAFDLFNAILREVKKRVMQHLKRDATDWRILHACPCCTHRLKDEPALLFSMLFAMDGNDSAKRIARRREDEEGLQSSERLDSRVGGEEYFLSRDEVDRWAHEVASAAHAKVGSFCYLAL
jgi:hypothetical protein